MRQIDLLPVAAPPATLETLAAAATDYVAAARAPSTLRAYRADWQRFTAWCTAQGLEALPARPEAVALYVTSLAQRGLKVPSVERALSAIEAAQLAGEYPSVRRHAKVKATVAGIRRSIGVAPDVKAPILPADLRAMVAALPRTRRGLRDRALLLVGFGMAARRSELIALDVADVAFTDEGLEVTIRRSKTDQEAEGAKLGIHRGRGETCPVAALRAWLDAAGIVSGPVFRSVDRHGRVGGRLDGGDVARIVKRTAVKAGLDPARLSGHSLRAGLATAAAKAGASERSIAKQTRHKSTAMLRRYIRDAELFTDNVTAGLL